jgi:hypothetical protein
MPSYMFSFYIQWPCRNIAFANPKWQVDKMTSWQNDKLTKWQVDNMTIWPNNKFMKWQVYEMQVYEMTSLWNDKFMKWVYAKW